MPLTGFKKTSFDYQGKTYPVFRIGEGPGVIIIHEIYGLTPKVAEFGRRIADAGFTSVLPSLFGTPGRAPSFPYVMRQVIRICISREFHVLASGHSSPITNALRALCREIHKELGGPGVGAIGMCLTGNFALSLMVDPVVMAPVLCQPSLPFAFTPSQRNSIHLSNEDIKAVKARVDNGVNLLGLRFSDDFVCPAQRFKRLKQEFGDGFESIVIDSSPGNPHHIPRRAHSVLTEDLVDKDGHPTRQALERVIFFFQEKLMASGSDQ